MPVDYHEPLDDGDIPISSHYVPDVGFIGVQGSPTINTDGSNKKSSPVNLNLAQVGNIAIALGQALKNGSISVTLASDQGAIATLDTNSAAMKSDLDAIKAAVQGTLGVSVSNFPGAPSIQRVGAIAGDFPAGSIVDLATLAAIVSGGKGAVKAGAGDFADLATLAGIVSSGKASVKASANDIVDLATLAGIVSGGKGAVKAALNDIVDLATLLARHTDTFGTSTAISAQTSLAAIPVIAGLVTNSFATLVNNSYQDTFLVQINVASAFVGTIGFYGLLPDGSTLQAINAHQRGTAINGNSSAINTGSALEQTWEGSIAGFKAIYVICSAFTSGAATVQIGLTAANYAHAIINTVAQNLTQVNGTPIALGQNTKVNSIPVTLPSDASIPINTGTPTETAVSVGTGNTSVLAANANRKFLSLINDSNNTIYVTLSGTNAALNTGIRLNANGGAILLDRYVPTAAVKAIATAASSNLLVEEG
jgi:hypothetical protein